jgi:hypothetical protein
MQSVYRRVFLQKDKNMTNRILMMMLAVFMLAACGQTGDSSSDATSAQNLQPALTGYQVQNVDNVLDAFAATAGTTAVGTGNVPLAATIERVNTLLQCMQDVGAISGSVYVQNQNVTIIPQAGISVVINKTRVERNVLSCLTQQPFSAQSVLDVQPCVESGSFIFEGQEYYYAFAGAGDGICAGFYTHFQNYDSTLVRP